MYTITPSCYKVADVPVRERPRELLERYGAGSVPLDVLLAVILRSGVRGQNVIDMARHLVRDYGSLTEIARADIDELAARPGMGRVKAQVLVSAFELAKRLSEEVSGDACIIKTPADAAELVRAQAKVLDREVFWICLLDGKNRIKGGPREITVGILNASLVHPREVFRSAVTSAAAAIILAHNHPSGDPAPSAEDIKLTKQLVEAGKIVGIQVLDHVIIGRRSTGREKDFISMREDNIVSFT